MPAAVDQSAIVAHRDSHGEETTFVCAQRNVSCVQKTICSVIESSSYDTKPDVSLAVSSCDTKRDVSLGVLPDELLTGILQYLPVVDTIRVERVCHRFLHCSLRTWSRARCRRLVLHQQHVSQTHSLCSLCTRIKINSMH